MISILAWVLSNFIIITSLVINEDNKRMIYIDNSIQVHGVWFHKKMKCSYFGLYVHLQKT